MLREVKNTDQLLEELITATTKPKLVSFLIPIGLPGLGKTYFKQNILSKLMAEQEGCSFKSICQDDIRQEMINSFLSENPTATYDAAMINTKDLLQSKFEEVIIHTIDTFVDNEE